MLLITGQRGFVGEYAQKQWPEHIGFDLKDGQDIREEAAVLAFFKEHRIDRVINLAARTSVRASTTEPDSFITTNIIGTRVLLKAAEECGVKHFIHFSSSSVYGNQNPPNDENAAMTPRSVYGMTKAASEMLCNMASVPTTIIRPFTLYGKDGRKDQVVYTWLNRYAEKKSLPFFGDGTSKRGYTHVLDMLDGVDAALQKGAPQHSSTYNLGGGEVVTLRQLRDIFQDELPDAVFEDLPRPEADAYENWADTQKAKSELGWEPKRNFESEMRAIIRSFKETL